MGPDCTLYAAAQDPGTASNDRPNATSSTPSFTCCAAAVRGDCYPRTSHRARPSNATSPTGRDSGLWARINRQLLMTARAARRTKRQPLGRHYRLSISQDHRKRRPTGFRCWQEDQGAQASYLHRYWRPAGHRAGPWRQCPGP